MSGHRKRSIARAEAIPKDVFDQIRGTDLDKGDAPGVRLKPKV